MNKLLINSFQHERSMFTSQQQQQQQQQRGMVLGNNSNSNTSMNNANGLPSFSSFPMKKNGLPCFAPHTESLLGMALYDFDTIASDVGLYNSCFSNNNATNLGGAGILLGGNRNHSLLRNSGIAPVFHPVDEYKDLSLKEILDLSDDFLTPDEQTSLPNHQQDPLLGVTPSLQQQQQSSISNNNNDLFEPMPLTVNGSNLVEQQRQLNQQRQILQQQQRQLQLLQQQRMQLNTLTPNNLFPLDSRLICNDITSMSNTNRSEQLPPDELADIVMPNTFEDAVGPDTFNASDELFPELSTSQALITSSSSSSSKKRSLIDTVLVSDGSTDEDYFNDDVFDSEDDIGCMDPSEANGCDRRFRPYQAGQWSEKFEELCQYREKMGHCLVPHTFTENLALARWVKRQRYQYKLMLEGKSSTMTEDRVKALEDIGFVWDSQGAAWGDRLHELQNFRAEFHHCNVPSNYCENPRLATWIKCQRRQYKLYMENKPSNMTIFRIQELEKLGFEWELRSYKKARTD